MLSGRTMARLREVVSAEGEAIAPALRDSAGR